ncbi:FH2 domain-containing protein 1 [Dermatophagoides pteronyssinus]|uniref:FH2 domain-containing protein 1 n=1 Tax=Dermatophagoides pteronyssinus TaxID=6956 RepID=A0ABQ8JQZ2_DERPT|nr:FH2 domain-containing protein 1 [Dermatophagoides pteronyssinus]
MNLFKNSFQSSNLQRKLFWYRFHSDYVYLYSETDKFNQTIRDVLLFLEMMSKSLVVICLLYYSHQTKMHLQNSLVTLIFITVFCLINILNFRIAHLPSYNRICWLSIHRWIARSQWSNVERKKHRNRLPLRYSFKSRLFLQTMTNNQFGFTCGRILNFRIAHLPSYNQICWLSIHRWIARLQWSNVERKKHRNRFPLRYSLKSRLFLQSMTRNQFGFTCGRIRSNQQNVKIKYFFMEIFQSIKFYAIRIDYQFLDYEQRNISWTFSTIKRAILFSLNSWLTIVYLFCLILWPCNDYLLSIDEFDKIVYSNRNDFIIIEMIIVFVLRECLFYNYLNELIKYKSKITEFLMKYCQYDDRELTFENQNHLIRFYKKSSLIATISYRILTIGLLSIYFALQLSIKSMNLLKNSIQSSNLQRKLFWYRFHSYYVYLYSETDKFNQTIQEVLLFLEMMSKSLVVICLLYYSHQTKMHLQNSLVTIILITVFCLINILNFRIAHIPLYNQICWLSIHRWIARSQWSNMERKKHRNRLPLRYYFKSRLFLSTMTNNQFGFQSVKYYALRIDYDLVDYEQRKISLAFSSIKRAIILALNSWISTMFLLSYVIWPHNDYFISIETFDEIVHAKRNDFIAIEMIIVFILRECLFFHHLNEFIKYKSKINEFLINYWHYNDNELSLEYRNHLIQFYRKSYSISIISYRIFTFGYWVPRHVIAIMSLFASTTPIPKLLDNWNIWFRSVKLTMISLNLWKFCVYSEEVVDDIASLNRAMAIIFGSLTEVDANLVLSCESPFSMLDALKMKYEGSRSSSIMSLKGEFYTLEYDDDLNFIGCIREINAKLMSLGNALEESDMCQRVLAILPHDYQDIVGQLRVMAEFNGGKGLDLNLSKVESLLRQRIKDQSDVVVTDRFYADSGSSSHIVNNRNWLVNYRECNELFDTAVGQINVLGYGDLNCECFTGTFWHNVTIRNVAYAKQKYNLISVGQIERTNENCSVVFSGGRMSVIKNGECMLTGYRSSVITNIYFLLIRIGSTIVGSDNVSLVSTSLVDLVLLHESSCHVNKETIVAKSEVVNDLSNIGTDNICCDVEFSDLSCDLEDHGDETNKESEEITVDKSVCLDAVENVLESGTSLGSTDKNETDKFNLVLRNILLFTEFCSKSLVVICLLFYSHQIKMHIQNTVTTFIFVALFCLTNSLYFRIAHLPSYNQNCCLSIHRWIARSQWSNVERKKHRNRLPFRYSLKSRLFLQSMTHNQFGFTCGRLNGFQTIKFHALRIDYDLFDYEHQNISWTFSKIKRSIFPVINVWMSLLFLIICVVSPFNDYFISTEIYDEIVNLKRNDFIFIEMIIVFFLRECLYYHHLFEFIHYKSKINEFLIKYWHYNDNELSTEYRYHLIQFYQKSCFISTISYRIFTIGLLAIDIIHQTKMYLENTLSTFILIAIFCLISSLNFLIADLPSYNRICWLSIHRWIARTQWSNMERKKFFNKFPLRYSIKSRLFLQSMTRNQFGFTCGQISLDQNIRINDIIRQGFQSVKFYALRIDYDLDDYEQRKIFWTFSMIKRTIILELNLLISIMFLFSYVIWPHNDYLISIDIFDKIVNANRNDFIVIDMIIVFILRECLYYYHLNEFIHYKSKINEFLIKYWHYNDNELSSEYRYYLIRFYQKSRFISTNSYRIFTIGLLAVNFMFNFFSFHLYNSGQISLVKFLMTSIFFFLFICQCIFIIGDSLILLSFIVFGIEFFRIRFKQLSIESMNIFKNSYQSSKQQQKLFWYRFHSQYVHLYSETQQFNLTLRYVLLFLEMMSKSLVVICLLFYSHQIKMHIQNTLVTLILIALFCLISGLNFRIAQLPSYNQNCCLSIHRWIARSQWSNVERKKHSQ